MVPVRIAFDAALPFVVSQEFTSGGRRFGDGEPFEWRELGIDQATLYNLWRSGMVSCLPAPSVELESPQRKRRAGR